MFDSIHRKILDGRGSYLRKITSSGARKLAALLLAGVIASAGCTQYEVGSLEPPAQPAANDDEASPDASATAPQTPASDEASVPDEGAGRERQTPNDDAQRDASEPSADQPTPHVEKADVGVGTKGKDYGGGIITEPARVFFRVEERITFQQVEHAKNLYKAEHGQFPESHEAFMEKVIEANQIELPGLPEGAEYWYDAEEAELMVKRPGR